MTAIKLILIFLIVAISCTFATIPKQQQQRNHPGLKDAKSDVVALLETMKSSLQQAIKTARLQINNYLELLDNAVTAILNDAKETLGDAIKPFLEAIKDLENEAVQAAVDISDCIGSSIEEINALPDGLVENVSSCLSNTLLDAKAYINQTMASFNSMFDIINDFADQIDVCGNQSSVQQQVCFKQISANITVQNSQLGLTISRDLGYLQVYVYTAIPQMAMCSVGTLDDIEAKGEAITANVTECAFKKINGTALVF